MKIDIRDNEVGKVEGIVFAEEDEYEKNCYLLTLEGDMSKISSAYCNTFVYLDSKEDALNLIKALQKAIELGNWDE